MLLSVNLNNNDSNSNTVRKTNHSKAKIKSWENEKQIITCVVVRGHLKTIYYFLEYQSQKIILEVQD
jgi:hypothetical protein